VKIGEVAYVPWFDVMPYLPFSFHVNALYISHGISLTNVKRVAFDYLIDVRPKPADTTTSQSSSSFGPTSQPRSKLLSQNHNKPASESKTMVARDRFKYRFKISALRHNSVLFLVKSFKMSFKEDFKLVAWIHDLSHLNFLLSVSHDLSYLLFHT